jgi:predicted transcriptional regulator
VGKKLRREAMVIIPKKEKPPKRITRSFRLRPDLVKKIEKIANEINETRTYVLESLLDYAIAAYEKERNMKSG